MKKINKRYTWWNILAFFINNVLSIWCVSTVRWAKSKVSPHAPKDYCKLCIYFPRNVISLNQTILSGWNCFSRKRNVEWKCPPLVFLRVQWKMSDRYFPVCPEQHTSFLDNEIMNGEKVISELSHCDHQKYEIFLYKQHSNFPYNNNQISLISYNNNQISHPRTNKLRSQRHTNFPANNTQITLPTSQELSCLWSMKWWMPRKWHRFQLNSAHTHNFFARWIFSRLHGVVLTRQIMGECSVFVV